VGNEGRKRDLSSGGKTMLHQKKKKKKKKNTKKNRNPNTKKKTQKKPNKTKKPKNNTTTHNHPKTTTNNDHSQKTSLVHSSMFPTAREAGRGRCFFSAAEEKHNSGLKKLRAPESPLLPEYLRLPTRVQHSWNYNIREIAPSEDIIF